MPHRRVPGADHDELGGVDDRNALPLYSIDTRCGRVEHYIDKSVIEQVDLIHIQDASIGLCLVIPDGKIN